MPSFAMASPPVPVSPWSFWEGAGVTPQLAEKLYEAGFTSKVALLQRVNQEGLAVLEAIPGIAKRRAQALFNWALVP